MQIPLWQSSTDSCRSLAYVASRFTFHPMSLSLIKIKILPRKPPHSGAHISVAQRIARKENISWQKKTLPVVHLSEEFGRRGGNLRTRPGEARKVIAVVTEFNAGCTIAQKHEHIGLPPRLGLMSSSIPPYKYMSNNRQYIRVAC